ncbi:MULTISPECIES: YrvL family regulatory protein [Shouchella]|uniref:YrvL family regulatory protein n=2 Tax=Shouchella TaxID=2893057 RepID=A0ABY7W4G0_9BACI|nr:MULTISPECIES: YrvL family regulatory protein [Shouchella]MED4129507.1 YrvL family regulatory protein [Shouchella miscanthi]WDF02772.1 YrvL family regulatory protein [Shouchella hunanensis]
MRKPSLSIIIGISLLLSVVFGFFFAVYYFGIISLFYLLGIEYDSLWALAWFVLLFVFGSFFIEVITKGMINTIVPKISGYPLQKTAEITIQFIFVFPLVHVLEKISTTITIPIITQAALAFLIVTIETLLANKDFTNQNKPS